MIYFLGTSVLVKMYTLSSNNFSLSFFKLFICLLLTSFYFCCLMVIYFVPFNFFDSEVLLAMLAGFQRDLLSKFHNTIDILTQDLLLTRLLCNSFVF